MTILRKKRNQSNKQGAMLILVLLIVALAVILISSALTMTKMTRTHYYDYTKMSQVQLTATSVAESIWDAIVVQAIDDDTVGKMADAKAHLEFSGLPVPGVAGGSSSSSYADFSRAGGKVIIDVVSQVGSETAKVRMVLTPPVPKTEANHFQYTVNMDGDGLIGEFNIGKDDGGATDNTMLVRGAMNSNLGSTNIYSNLVATKPFSPASGQKFYGDVIFWGENSGWDKGNGAGLNLLGQGTVFFVSPSGTLQNALKNFDSNANQNIVAKSVVFYNSTFNNTSEPMWGQLASVTNIASNRSNDVTFPGSNSISNGGYQNSWNNLINNQTPSIQSALLSQAADYVSAKNIAAFSGDSLPTLSSQASSFGVSTTPNGTPVTSFDALTAYNVVDEATGLLYVKPGTYQIQSGSLSGTVRLDLSKGNYTFYVLSGGTISGTLSVENGTKLDSNWCNMVVSNGQTIKVTGKILTKDGPKPYLKVWGMGGVTIDFPLDGSGGAICQAYICLYDNPGEKSKITYNTGDSCSFYGRITCSIIERRNGGGFINIPYCVDPTYKVNAGKIVPLETEYTIDPFQYYN
ncbi:MAG: hypothetical protein MJ172_00225 [Clostridia bacterium]|nr:hypothetical protein [Clostridia bacterium]